MSTDTSIHPYYVAKATEALENAAANPDADPTQLARWASEDHKDCMAIVTADGRIVGEALYQRGGDVQAYYITSCEEESKIGYELGFAGRVNGELVCHFKHSQLAHGPAPRRH